MSYRMGDVCRHKDGLVIITDWDDKEAQAVDPEFEGVSQVVEGVFIDDMKDAIGGVEGVDAFRYGLKRADEQGLFYPFIVERLEPYGEDEPTPPWVDE